ncbi:phage holin family protein [Streptomyces sp. P38-E01]|uniref:Phage holin family protein n=1 Tax=Streptomyces tardus TaxID=2780544 RepID=A0A949JLD9_9ACTN|nr:phage holin family protein [Streptomyces tardus]MBU7597271.1 phage holin family protein [Streptomyces tardus]
MSTAANGKPSLGDLVSRASEEMSNLFRAEVALAKSEVKSSAIRGAVSIAFFAVAGVLALFSLPVFSFALAYWLYAWWSIPLAIAFLITGGLMLLFAVVCGWLAARLMKKLEPPKKAIASAKDSAAVLANAKPHPRRSTEPEAVRLVKNQ